MRKIEKIRGIIINRHEVGEADVIVRIYSKKRGKLSAIAKNAVKSRRRFGSGLKLFQEGEFDLQFRGTLHFLNSYKVISSFNEISSVPFRYVVGCVFTEAVLKLSAEESSCNSERVYQVFINFLEKLKYASDKKEALLFLFLSLNELLRFTGFLGDSAVRAEPTALNLKNLLHYTESVCESKFKSTEEVERMIESLF